MRIIVLGRFPPPFDGQAIATQRLSQLLSERFAVRNVDIQPGNASARREKGVTLRRSLHFLKLRGYLSTELRDLGSACVIWPAISPDTFGHIRDVFSILPPLREAGPIVAVLHRGNFDKVFRTRAARTTARRLVTAVSAFVFNTDGLSARCAPWIPKQKRFVISNVVDQDVEFTEAEVVRSQEARRDRDSLRILFLSNMHREKGYLDLLEAAKALKHQNLPATFQFVGAWQNRQDQLEFEQYVKQAGLETVEHLGPVLDRQEIKRLYNECDIVALPTYYPNEAQPVSMVEALSAGRPIISTRHAGIPEMVEDGREGYLVPKRDSKAIAEAISRMTSYSVWLKHSRASRDRYNRQFAPDKVLADWISLLSKLGCTDQT